MCVAFGLASGSCLGGPISDYPGKSAGDEDDDGPPRSPPTHAGGVADAASPRFDAGASAGGADASVVLDASAPGSEVGDSGDAGDAGTDAAASDAAASDAAAALPNALDGGGPF